MKLCHNLLWYRSTHLHLNTYTQRYAICYYSFLWGIKKFYLGTQVSRLQARAFTLSKRLVRSFVLQSDQSAKKLHDQSSFGFLESVARDDLRPKLNFLA